MRAFKASVEVVVRVKVDLTADMSEATSIGAIQDLAKTSAKALVNAGIRAALAHNHRGGAELRDLDPSIKDRISADAYFVEVGRTVIE